MKIDVDQRHNHRFQKLHDNAVQYMSQTGVSLPAKNKQGMITKK